MVAYNKVNQFVEDIGKAVHNLSTGALTIALTTTANKPVATNTVLANLTQVSYTNMSTRVLASVTYAQTSGTAKLIANDLVITASGATASFGVPVLYNDTPTSPADPLIAWWEYGSDISLATGETFTLDLDNTNGIFSLA